MNENIKSGVSLIALVMVIIVLIMFAGLAGYSGIGIMQDIKEATFYKDNQTIEDATEEYYLVNGDIPIKTGGLNITKAEFLQHIKEKYGQTVSNKLDKILIKNKEEDSNFYEIDIQKIDVESSKYGLKTKGEDDIFLVSNTTAKVYYYSAFKYRKNIYFTSETLE
ncbi:MAG: hypothetical protein PHR25_03595 [Clostridia bacterium]|nr:hypothetical protein [Clostridia bacterium]MDD4375845.1 hypothetical protein [Clostridia bacterium]